MHEDSKNEKMVASIDSSQIHPPEGTKRFRQFDSMIQFQL